MQELVVLASKKGKQDDSDHMRLNALLQSFESHARLNKLNASAQSIPSLTALVSPIQKGSQVKCYILDSKNISNKYKQASESSESLFIHT